MKASLKALAARVDGMTLRERALIFVGAAGMLVLLVHAFALQPVLRTQRAHVERIKSDASQLKAVEDALAKSADAGRADPLEATRARIRTAEEKLAESERQLVDQRASQASPEQLSALLHEVLGRSRNLKLISLRVVPSAAVAPPPAPAPAKAGKAAPKPPVQLYRHGVEVEMAGGYLALLRFLEEVEALPWRLSWSGVELRTASHPEIVLRATLFTVTSTPSLLKL